MGERGGTRKGVKKPPFFMLHTLFRPFWGDWGPSCAAYDPFQPFISHIHLAPSAVWPTPSTPFTLPPLQVCSGLGPCAAAHEAGWATIFRHPSQFGSYGVCPAKFDVPCGEPSGRGGCYACGK